MTETTFNWLVHDRISSCMNILQSKSDEYARDADKLHNFKMAGSMLGCTPERALIGMWAKHIVSILDIVRDLDSGKLPEAATLGEKMNDAINYLYLLEALIVERGDK